MEESADRGQSILKRRDDHRAIGSPLGKAESVTMEKGKNPICDDDHSYAPDHQETALCGNKYKNERKCLKYFHLHHQCNFYRDSLLHPEFSQLICSCNNAVAGTGGGLPGNMP